MKLNHNNGCPLERFMLSGGRPNLNGFINCLEQYYFAKVTLSTYEMGFSHLELALNVDSPLSLSEMLDHFTKNEWGYCETHHNPLQKSLAALGVDAHFVLDIMELNLYLKDTNIIIKRVAHKSIIEQFNSILSEIANQYIFISKGLTETPFEIYIPVYEDVMCEDSNRCNALNTSVEDYYTYWGIYLDSETDAEIYDVRKRKYIPANLDLSILD